MTRAEADDNLVLTGRDGGVDYAAKMASRDTTPVAHGEGHVYRVIEVVGTSPESIDGAVKSAIDRAHRTIRHLRWFEVARTSGHIDEGKVSHFQVTLKVGFTMEEGL
jgi:flavin-binding protein dodecin